MGGHYLRLEGESEDFWTAARDHYRPQGFDGDLPSSLSGRLLGAAERLDTLVGLFGIGEIPSGSRDPFGLRRAAQGLVRIVAEAGWDLELGAAIDRAGEQYGSTLKLQETSGPVRSFVADRVRRYLVEFVGVAQDTAEAVMAANWTQLPALVARARALDQVRSAPQFRMLALAFKRVRNITEGQEDFGVDSALFEAPEEAELYERALAFHTSLGRLLPERQLDGAFAAMEPLAEVLDRFFVEVLVMTENERIRNNRIALLKYLGRDFMTLADLSKLQVEGGEQ
jgi:glycyl-tRNA synthetase beta chain